MPRVGFEPTIPVFERAMPVLALDRTATVIGGYLNQCNTISVSLIRDILRKV
jgi:hypothetical protein